MSMYKSTTHSWATITNNLFWLNYLATNLQYICSSLENIIGDPMTSVELFMWKKQKIQEVHFLLSKIIPALQLAIKLKIIAERQVVVDLFSFQDSCCIILWL